MSDPSEISSLVSSITSDVRSIVADEIALAKAEIKPAVRRVGVGSGLFGAAGYFVFSATIVLWFTIAAGFAWLYAACTSASGWACAFFGALTAVVLLIIIGAILGLAGKKSFHGIKGPQRTSETISQALAAAKSGVQEGKDRVEAEIHPSGDSYTISAPVGATAKHML